MVCDYCKKEIEGEGVTIVSAVNHLFFCSSICEGGYDELVESYYSDE